MKSIELKCENCGSVSFNQISDDVFECSYCSAKIQNNNSVKNEFIKDLDKNNNKNIKFIKAKFTEEEFFKHAISHLTINKHSPSDLLEKAKFGIVEYDYAFFAVLDIDFSLVTVNNATTFSDGEKSIKISSNQQVNYNLGKTFCIELGKDIDNSYMSEVLDFVEEMHPSVFSSKSKEGSNIKYPTKQEVEYKINQSVEDYKKQLLLNKENKVSNRCIHNIISVDIIALPIYTLKYDYNGKKYKISTSANKLNFIGDAPNANNQITQNAKKKTVYLSTCSVGMSLIAIIFAVIHLKTRLLGHIGITLCLVLGALGVFIISLIAYSASLKKLNKQCYENKLEQLKVFFKRNSKNFTEKDQSYIENYLRWF